MKVTPETVVLINCGCEGIQKLARAVRAQKVYTMVIPYSAPAERVGAEKPAGLLLVSDGPCARLDEARRKFASLGVPVMEITDPENAAEAAVDAAAEAGPDARAPVFGKVAGTHFDLARRPYRFSHNILLILHNPCCQSSA